MATMVKDRILEQATERIDALAERAKAALYSAANSPQQARGAFAALRGPLWRLAGRSSGEAGGFAGEIYERGQRTALALGRRVEEQPWQAVAVAAVVGLMLGYRLRQR